MCPQPAQGAEVGTLSLSKQVPGAGGCAAAFQVHYLGSLASEPSFEDDVGRGPPLLRSLALASEASASAQKWGEWLAQRQTEGRASQEDHQQGAARPTPQSCHSPGPRCQAFLLPTNCGPLLARLRRTAPTPLTHTCPPTQAGRVGLSGAYPMPILPEGMPSTQSDP